jgi:hypothetical protein
VPLPELRTIMRLLFHLSCSYGYYMSSKAYRDIIQDRQNHDSVGQAMVGRIFEPVLENSQLENGIKRAFN